MQLQRSFSIILTVLLSSSISISNAQSNAIGSLVIPTFQGSDKCIEVENGNFVNGATQVIQSCDSNSTSQSWQFVDSDQTGQQLLQTSNGYCLDVPNGNAVNNQQLQIWKCSSSNSNQFFSQNGNQIEYNNSNLCLNMLNGKQNNFTDGTPLQLFTCDSSDPNSDISQTLASLIAPSELNSYGKPGLTAVFNQTRKRMLAWGYDNSVAPMMAKGSKIGSYYHWENNVIPGMPSDVPYIPMYWGISKTAQWNAVKQTIGSSVPPAVIGFNEPDVISQANMDPISAANLYYNQITKVYGTQGSNLISPPIVWNVEGWLDPFMNACEKLGCGISAIGYHQYISLSKDAGGSVDNAVALLQTRITNLYNKYKMPILLNELGLTQAGGGTTAQLNDFMVQSGRFLDNSTMVLAWALSAVFRKGDGWDNFLNSNLAFFNPDGTLSALGSSYMNDTF